MDRDQKLCATARGRASTSSSWLESVHLGSISGSISGFHLWGPSPGSISRVHLWGSISRVHLWGSISGVHLWGPSLGVHVISRDWGLSKESKDGRVSRPSKSSGRWSSSNLETQNKRGISVGCGCGGCRSQLDVIILDREERNNGNTGWFIYF